MLTVDEHRFLHDLNLLAEIGMLPIEQGGGRDRRAFSQAERAARELFTVLAGEAGLDVRTDSAGNLSAILASENRNARTLLFGSHMDTVPNGGPFDGALGVIAGLEAMRTLREAGVQLPVTLECVAFTDEEGRYCGLTGSQLLAGTYSGEATQRFHDLVSVFAEDVSAMNELLPEPFTVDSLLAAKRPADNIIAFVELHIEQGPQLQRAGKTIGIVDAIFGRVSCQVTFTGRSDHAGTTPMHLRSDALAAAAHFIAHMTDFVRKEYPFAVFTCGDVAVQPGADNVVPREARVLVEYRASSSDVLDRIGQELASTLSKTAGVDAIAVHTNNEHRLEPRPMHPAIQSAVCDSCCALGYSSMTLSSGALHDAHSMAAVAPAGMIFVPSKAGRSHCPEEDTDPEDLTAGANVLLHTIVRLAETQLR